MTPPKTKTLSEATNVAAPGDKTALVRVASFLADEQTLEHANRLRFDVTATGLSGVLATAVQRNQEVETSGALTAGGKSDAKRGFAADAGNEVRRVATPLLKKLSHEIAEASRTSMASLTWLGFSRAVTGRATEGTPVGQEAWTVATTRGQDRLAVLAQIREQLLRGSMTDGALIKRAAREGDANVVGAMVFAESNYLRAKMLEANGLTDEDLEEMQSDLAKVLEPKAFEKLASLRYIAVQAIFNTRSTRSTLTSISMRHEDAALDQLLEDLAERL